MSDIWTILATLPQAQQQAILLREIKGLSYDEIARIAGVDRKQVAERLRSARRELMACMRAAEEESHKVTNL